MAFSVNTENWDPKGRYEFGIAAGYFFAGRRNVMRKGVMTEIPVKHEKQLGIFKDTLAQFVELADGEGGLPFFIVDDGSPVSPSIDELKEIIGDNPFLFVRFPRNLGVSTKENVVQRVLKERCDYVLRFDADVSFDPFDLDYFRDGFKANPDAWSITPCITYFARLDASQLPEKQRYFTGSNSADFLAYDSRIFDEIGYSEWKIRYNNDGDLRIRAKAVGKFCYVDKHFTGKAQPSGGGTALEQRLKDSRYLEKTRPFIKAVYPKGKPARLMLDKKKVHLAKGFRVPAHPIGEKIAKAVWK